MPLLPCCSTTGQGGPLPAIFTAHCRQPPPPRSRPPPASLPLRRLLLPLIRASIDPSPVCSLCRRRMPLPFLRHGSNPPFHYTHLCSVLATPPSLRRHRRQAFQNLIRHHRCRPHTLQPSCLHRCAIAAAIIDATELLPTATSSSRHRTAAAATMAASRTSSLAGFVPRCLVASRRICCHHRLAIAICWPAHHRRRPLEHSH